MRDRIIFTIVAGDFHRFLGTLTHPQMEKYAARVGADFTVVPVPNEHASACCWEKYRIANMLRDRKRVLYVDTDVFIKDDAEDIFAAVPEEKFGAFDETGYQKDFVNMIQGAYLREIGVPTEEVNRCIVGPYFNAGVMLASRGQEKVFTYPGHPAAYEHDWDYYGDQAAANYNLMHFGVPYHDITSRFNLMMGNESAQIDSRIPLQECSFFHFAGAFKQANLGDRNIQALAEARIADLKGRLK